MSQLPKVFTIILSSPGDVLKERDIVVKNVQELNLTLQKFWNALIELRKWETHSKPSARGKYSQEIITVDLGDDFDIYLGIMWTKFGTPTPNAGSGTEEEFNHAYDLLKVGKNIDIMFYFSQRKQQPNKSLQIGKVLAFKEKIQSLPVFTWDYKSLDDFSTFTRLHLSHKIYDILQKSSTKFLDYKKAVEINSKTRSLSDEMGMITKEIGLEAEKYKLVQEELSNYLNTFHSDVILSIYQINRSLLTYKLKVFNENIRKIINKAYAIMENQTNLFIQWVSIYTEMIFLIPQSPLSNKLEIIDIAHKAIYILIDGFNKTIEDLKPMETQALSYVEQNPLPQINAAFNSFYNFISNYPKTFQFYLLLAKNAEIKLNEIKQSILNEQN